MPHRFDGRPFANRQIIAAIAFLLLLASAGFAQTPGQPHGWDGRGAGAQSEPAPQVPVPHTPSLNFYGSPGLVDMPSAEMMPDGQFALGMSYFKGGGRVTLTTQFTPWLSGSFRYTGVPNLNQFGFSTYYDRSFDVRLRLAKEGQYRPALSIGLQDFAGTGVFAGEYIVATKNFSLPPLGSNRQDGRLKVTAGLGWGRFGSHGSIGDTGPRPPPNAIGTGGTLSYDSWFRGPFAPFGGIEYQVNDKLGLKLEYSSDAYTLESQVSQLFERKSSVNLGVEYQATPRTRLGAYYLYGSEFGLNIGIQLNPNIPTTPLATPAPLPITPRPAPQTAPEAWDASWVEVPANKPIIRDALAQLLRANGLILEGIELEATEATLYYRNQQYYSFATATGRAARSMAQLLPASVETFHLVSTEIGMPIGQVTVRRSDLEALEYAPDASEALRSVVAFSDAPRALGKTALAEDDLYPAKGWSLIPYFQPSYFDPTLPFRLDVGAELRGAYRPAPGWIFAGAIRQRIWGNIKDGRLSNSVLPHVRTDQTLYAQADTTLHNLYGAYQWRPGKNLYARVTAGYLERMFGGFSSELLWKPIHSRLALGVEANYVAQRDNDQRFGFSDYNYSVATGHASAYYEFGNGYIAQIDAGRYLAGDWGATFSLDRVFDNGWRFGGFFTRTNVSAQDFGEGSFDKGIRIEMPISWFLGTPSRQIQGINIRPTQRDGGQRLDVPLRLYNQVRAGHRRQIEGQWGSVWE